MIPGVCPPEAINIPKVRPDSQWLNWKSPPLTDEWNPLVCPLGRRLFESGGTRLPVEEDIWAKLGPKLPADTKGTESPCH